MLDTHLDANQENLIPKSMKCILKYYSLSFFFSDFFVFGKQLFLIECSESKVNFCAELAKF
jgi:hypothetical protein